MKVEAAARPMEALRIVEKEYPYIWENAASCRAAKGAHDIGDWPSYCWIPMTAWNTIIGYNVLRLPVVSAVGTWRLSKGVYIYNEDLMRELISTPMTEQAPTEVFHNLPEFCVYIDTQYSADYSGFFAHLEYDMSPNPQFSSDDQPHSELRLLYLPRNGDIFTDSVSIMLHIDNNNIINSLREVYGKRSEEILENITSDLSLLLYLCSEAPDLETKNLLNISNPNV